VVRELRDEAFCFRLVGTAAPEVSGLLLELGQGATLVAKLPQHELPREYAQADLYLFPTIEDGFAVVLAQAQASALPILTTTNCSGADLVREGETGWVLPIRSPAVFVERLRWCAAHRAELAAMVRRAYAEFQPRDWSAVAADFERVYAEIRVKDQYATH